MREEFKFVFVDEKREGKINDTSEHVWNVLTSLFDISYTFVILSFDFVMFISVFSLEKNSSLFIINLILRLFIIYYFDIENNILDLIK